MQRLYNSRISSKAYLSLVPRDSRRSNSGERGNQKGHGWRGKAARCYYGGFLDSILEHNWLSFFQVHRLNAIKDAEKIESLKAAKRMEGARQIMDQIKSNTEVRILEEEKKNAERWGHTF